MNPFFDKIQRLANDSVQTGLSLVKIALFSKWKTPVPSVSGFSEELVILGNGPSLNTTIDEHYSFLENKTLLAVNFAGATPVFERLRPALYVIADPYFYSGTQQRATDLFRHIRETVTWDMVLFMPAVASGKGDWHSLIEKNRKIHVVYYNTTPVEGYKWFTRMAYRYGWGGPRPRNVLIPSLMLGLRMRFGKIYIAGADHSWTTQLSVDDNNRVLTVQPHFYKESEQEVKQVFAEYAKVKLHEVLYSMSVAFRSYFAVEDYARYSGIKIYNITPGSFIDAFQRLKI